LAEESGCDVHAEKDIFCSAQRPTKLSNQWIPGVPYARVKRSGPSPLLHDVGMVDQTSALLVSGFLRFKCKEFIIGILRREDYISLPLCLFLHLTEYFVSKHGQLNVLNFILDAYIKMKQILLRKNLIQLLLCKKLETKLHSSSHWWLELLRSVTS